MSSVLLDKRPLPRTDNSRQFKKSLYASLAIHGGILVFLIVLSVMPHRLRFEPMSLIELQGLSAGHAAGGGNVQAPALAPKTSLPAPAAPAPVSTLKPKARESKAEKITVKKSKAPAKAIQEKAPPKSDLRDRILQKFKSMPAAENQNAGNTPKTSGASGIAVATGNAQGPAGIATSVPFPFAWYLAEVQARITDAWDEPGMLARESQEARSVVLFRIDRQGAISRVALASSSGITALDDSALRAVEAANPLPPLPEEFTNAYLDIHLQFDLIHDGP